MVSTITEFRRVVGKATDGQIHAQLCEQIVSHFIVMSSNFPSSDVIESNHHVTKFHRLSVMSVKYPPCSAMIADFHHLSPELVVCIFSIFHRKIRSSQNLKCLIGTRHLANLAVLVYYLVRVFTYLYSLYLSTWPTTHAHTYALCCCLLPLLVDGASESHPEQQLKCSKAASGKQLQLEIVVWCGAPWTAAPDWQNGLVEEFCGNPAGRVET